MKFYSLFESSSKKKVKGFWKPVNAGNRQCVLNNRIEICDPEDTKKQNILLEFKKKQCFALFWMYCMHREKKKLAKIR